jgi:hypothetical protein
MRFWVEVVGRAGAWARQRPIIYFFDASLIQKNYSAAEIT